MGSNCTAKKSSPGIAVDIESSFDFSHISIIIGTLLLCPLFSSILETCKVPRYRTRPLHRIFCLKAFNAAVIPVGSHPGAAVFYCLAYIDAARRAENLRMGDNPEKTGVDIDTRLKPLPVNG